LGIGFAGVSLAFGLTGVYALGHISRGHFNPAVSVGLWFGGRFDAKHLIPYIISQVIGASLAGLVLYLIIQGFRPVFPVQQALPVMVLPSYRLGTIP
jgi:aquaporin Z